MGTTHLTAATSILRYWLDIEALTPPSVETEAGFIRVDDRTPDINWTMGLPDDRQQRTINIVHIGLFNLEFAAQDIAPDSLSQRTRTLTSRPQIVGKDS